MWRSYQACARAATATWSWALSRSAGFSAGPAHGLLDGRPGLARRFTGVRERQVWVAAEPLLSGAAAEAVAKNPGSLALECSGGGGPEGQAATDATVHGAGVDPGPQRLVGDAFSLSHSAISTAIYEEPVG